jgi:hypothetical protein
MGAKTCLLAQVLAGNARQILAALPAPDKATTTDLVASLFPGASFAPPGGADLSYTFVRDGEVVAGCFPGLHIVAAREVAVDRPSQLPSRFIAPKGTTLLHAMHSVADWFAFAVWEDGVLRRSLSVAPDSGVLEDMGERFAFERPYWEGAHPAVDPDEGPESYPLPFHPLELGEAALREYFGFQLEGYVDPSLLEPERIRMFRFLPPGAGPRGAGARKAWWKFW